MSLRSLLMRDEGREHRAYPDPLSHGEPWSIGVGHTGPEVVPGLVWSDEQIDAALDADITIATSLCERNFSPWFDALDEPRRGVLIMMAFQMGHRLLNFVRMLGFVRDERFPQAAEEMRNSMWARQTPRRAIRLAHQLEVGAWQG